MNNELRAFVKESLERGLERDAVRSVLLQAGWREDELRDALASFADIDFPVAVPRPRPYLHAREAFFYLVSFIALYVTAFSFGAVMFGIIDRAFPDALDYGYYGPSVGQAAAVASVIVTFPIYLFLMKRLATGAAADSERRQSLVRRWLTYLTLVGVSGIIIGDLIALLANLLAGDPTIRFALKALTILAIASCIFGYYFHDMRRAEAAAAGEKAARPLQALLAGVVLVVIAGLGYSIFLMGTPGQQREIRLDRERVEHLSNISDNIDVYWGLNGELPRSMNDMAGSRYYIQSIEDPETGIPYEYNITGEAEYELCAVFAAGADRRGYPDRRFSEKAWDHGAGKTCFPLEAKSIDAPPGAPNRPPQTGN